MPTHKLITETHGAVRDQCDLCGEGKPRWVYNGRTEVTRAVRDTGIVVDLWVESTWLTCQECAALVEAKDNLNLLRRMNRDSLALPLTRRHALTIAGFFEALLPGRQQLGGEHEA
jgi:hypothetical protein